MPEFTDKTGDTWHVEIDLPMILEIRSSLHYDLLHLGTLDQLVEIIDGSLRLLDVLQIVCHEQIAKRELSAMDFARRFSGETIDTASRAVVEALVDFFPPRQRVLLRKALDSGDRHLQLMTDQAMTKLDDPAYWETVIASMDQLQRERTYGSRSTSSPASPDSAVSTSVG